MIHLADNKQEVFASLIGKFNDPVQAKMHKADAGPVKL